jgi:YbbR domain-containing protein
MKKGRFNKFITTNPWLKLASLVLAVVLWFFVVSKGRSAIVMDVPIELKNIPAKLEVVDGPKTVNISIEGQERFLKKLREEDISVIIDLSEVRKGKTSFSLSVDNIVLPHLLTVTKILPQTIKLMVDKQVKKDVPVRPIIVGSPAVGFLVEGIKVVPKMIQVEGPESIVAKVYTVKTESIDITGVTSSLHYSARVDISKENIRVDVSEVEVNIAVRKVK